MSKKTSQKTFRLAFVRGRIRRAVRSQRLREALLEELNGGQDAALVIRMVERVHPVPNQETRPTQEVRPTPIPAPPPCPVHGRIQPQPGPAQPQAPVPPPAPAPADGNSRATAVDVLDSDEEFVQDMRLSPRRERRLRAQIQSWKSSSSE